MDRIPVPPWKALLERKTAEHYRRFHPEIFTRRGFIGAAGAAGLAAASSFTVVPLALAGWFPPWAAGLGMAASSLFVVLNALRIDRSPALT